MYVPFWEPDSSTRRVPNEALYVMLSRIEKPNSLITGQALTRTIVDKRYGCKDERTNFIAAVCDADKATSKNYRFPPDSPVQDLDVEFGDSDDDVPVGASSPASHRRASADEDDELPPGMSYLD